MDLNRIKCFAAVVEAESLTAAADALETSKSAISRALQSLEKDLGVRLLHRTTRKLSLTDAGRIYFDHVKGALAQLDEASSLLSAMETEPRGVVRITAPDLGGLILPKIVAEFVSRYPKIRIELSLSARVVDLVEENMDLAIRSGRLRSSSLVARRIGNQTSGLYASQAYLDRRGRPRTVAELSGHDCIVIRRPTDSEGSGSGWRLYKGGKQESVNVAGPLVVDDLLAAWEAVRLGIGIGLIPAFGSHSEALVRILPRYASLSVPINIVWPSRRLEPTRVVLFREFLISALAREK